MFGLNLNAILLKCVVCNEMALDVVHGFFGNENICHILSMAFGQEKVNFATKYVTFK